LNNRKPSGFSGRYGRLGLILTVVGAILAVDTLANLSFMYKLWPLLIVLPGIGFVGIFIRRSRREAIYIGVGTFLLGFSGLALYCSLTSWAALASLWPLFLTLLGVSFCVGYFFGNRVPFLLLAGLLLISLSVVFFFVFGITHKLWWSILVLAGLSFLIFDRINRAE
jgi:hypothetical protein